MKYIKGELNLVPDSLSRNFLGILMDKKITETIESAHISTGHSGIEATYITLQKQGITNITLEQVRSYIKNCNTCIQFKKGGNKYKLFPGNHNGPFDTIGIDLIGL
ncbi:hypothetical protein ENBRE01_2864 [Enteropsectra breve]|nr:hypothetical protein ENBRE01_2864 [Enteropsectra breve]